MSASTTTSNAAEMNMPIQNGVINSEPSTNSEATIMVNGGSGCSSSVPPSDLTSFANELTRINGHQQEQELFLQAFEKPTQIYRFLRNRHLTSPIFLTRSLSYMKERMSRSNKRRNNFKINNILGTILAKQKHHNLTNSYLNVVFNGLFCDADNCNNLSSSPVLSSPSSFIWQCGDIVTIEAVLCKITKSKRKDTTLDFQEIWSDQINLAYGSQENSQQMLPCISIPAQSMHTLDDQHITYKLLFRIYTKPTEQDDSNSSTTTTATHNSIDSPLNSKRSRYTTQKFYGCELIIYEKNIGCIPEGDYDTALRELNCDTIKSFSPKKRNWETLENYYVPITVNLNLFDKSPTLKFRLIWSNSELPRLLELGNFERYASFIEKRFDTPSSDGNDNEGDNQEYQEQYNCHNHNINGNNHNHDIHLKDMINNNNHKINDNTEKCSEKYVSNTIATSSSKNNNIISTKTKSTLSLNREKIQIVYNFLYSNNTRQQTEYTQEMSCPWCGIDCLRLYSLLKHLKLCHGRFNFTYHPGGVDNCARIDVTINDAYDGSYAGSPYDLAGSSGCSFARTCGPVRRTSVTNLLVCRPRRQKTCLDEFLVLDEDDLSNQRPYVTGHNRLYHHTETCLPVHPKELDIDSEGECDPLWLRQKTIQMIDEFTDVNEGEKELMKLWNLHVMKHGFVGDCQLPIACEMFLEANGHDIIRKNIYRNFILHMCSLFDYGLVSPETVYKIVQKLQSIISKYTEGREMMSKQREAQLKYWLDVGIHKQDEQKLKSPQKNLVESSVIILDDNDVKLNAENTESMNKNVKVSENNATSPSTPTTSTTNTMQPPIKRSNTSLKRSCSMHLSTNTNERMNINNKNVVRKSVLKQTVNNNEHDNEVNSSRPTGFKRLSATQKNKQSQVNSKNHDTRTSVSKRRYHMKTVNQPSPKRQCNLSNTAANKNNSSITANNSKSTANSINSNSNNIAKNSTTATSRNNKSNNNNSSNQLKQELPSWTSRRIATRHQTNSSQSTATSSSSTNATGSGSGSSRNMTEKNRSNNNNISTCNINGTTNNIGNSTVSNKATVYTMRTRLSVPVSNNSKIEKR